MNETNFMPNDFITISCNPFDFKIFQTVVNQGIDSHLQAFTKSQFFPDSSNKNRFVFKFHHTEIPILLRRLREYGREEYIIWAEDIELVYSKKFASRPKKTV